MKRRIIVGTALIALFFCLNHPEPVAGCASVPPRRPVPGCAPPRGFDIAIRDEFALIVWDPKTKLEHFIRVANFQTDAPDLGFLVPTPSVPTLAEVNAARISRILKQHTKRRVVTQTEYVTRYGLGPLSLSFLGMGGASSPSQAAPAVEVLGEYNVAGYDATVLRAEDPAALRDWLDERQYVTSDALQDWLQIYTQQKWIITAFKLSKNGQSPGLSSKGVRMSFQSDRPFYPYREPSSDGVNPTTGGRLLKVFLLSDQRYDGRIGSERPWSARTVWSGPMGDYSAKELLTSAGVGATSIPKWLTEYDDRSFPRLGIDELYFDKASSQARVERPVKTRIVKVDKFFPGWGGAFIIGTVATPLIVLSAIGFWILRRGRLKSGNPKSVKSQTK